VALSPDRCGAILAAMNAFDENKKRETKQYLRPVNNDGRFPSSSLTLVK